MKTIEMKDVNEVEIAYVNEDFKKSLCVHYKRMEGDNNIFISHHYVKDDTLTGYNYICERCGEFFDDMEYYQEHLDSDECDNVISEIDLSDLLNDFIQSDDFIRCIIYANGDIVYHNLLENSKYLSLACEY